MMAKRQNVMETRMKSTTVRSTLYLDPALHRAVRLKAASTHQTISQIVNEAVREALREDEADLATVTQRAREKTMGYEAFLIKLKTDGTL